jgi:hypothetical protein
VYTLDVREAFLRAGKGLVLTGKRFRLTRATLSLEGLNGKRKAITVPAGSIVRVISGPMNTDGLVNVVWGDRELSMFEVDLNVRGTEMTDQANT